MGTPAARTMDKVTHPLPGQLMPGPGSFNVLIGNMPAWRGLPAAQAAALQAAQAVADAALQVAQAATMAAMGTPAAPAAKAAEIAARTAAASALGSMMQGLAASCAALGGMPDTHVCATLIPPPVPHGPGMVIDGSPTVLTNGLPQCAVGDKVLEAIGGPDPILMGCFTVLVGKSASGGGGGGGGIMDALKAAIASLIAKALDVLDKVVDTVQKFAAFVNNLVKAVIAGLANFVEQLGRHLVERVVKALGDFAYKVKKAVDDLTAKKVKSGLGDDVDAIASKSPTLTKNIEALKKDGWTIKYGEAGKGTFCDKEAKEIVIDSNEKGDPAGITQSLAHESGHALYTVDPYVPHDGLSKADYVDKNVKRDLKDEGEATLTNAQVRNEIIANGGEDIGIAGAQSAKYDEIAKKYPDPKDREKAREEIGDVFAHGETPSGDQNAGKDYYDYYAKTYQDFYDEQTAP